MPPNNRESDEHRNTKDRAHDISLAVEKLVAERLGKLQDSFLLGNRLFRKSESSIDEASFLKSNVIPSVQARIITERTDYEVGESFQLEIQIQNTAKTPLSINRIEALTPPGFETFVYSNPYKIVSTFLDLQGKKLDPNSSESIEISLISTRKGTFLFAPRIIYTNSMGLQMSCEPEPMSINVSETTLPNRVKTGFKDLDNLLFGGLPRNSAVILTSISCDERDLLVKRFLEASAKEGNITFCAIVDPEGVRSLAEEYKKNFHVLVCSSTVDEDFEKLPNVLKATSIENLTEVNIALETFLRSLHEIKQLEGGGRACLEILSDILLEHGAVQTRKWLSRLIPELRSRGFTTLAVVNPHMHTSEQLHAILDLFDGEISIYEKGENDLTKYLRIRKMIRQRYLESELPLRKTRLMTTPLTLSCCRRAFNV
jgi:KaiC/GvpD/RAD55 family RecA-like ATPase